jgi:hypothetical protein
VGLSIKRPTFFFVFLCGASISFGGEIKIQNLISECVEVKSEKVFQMSNLLIMESVFEYKKPLAGCGCGSGIKHTTYLNENNGLRVLQQGEIESQDKKRKIVVGSHPGSLKDGVVVNFNCLPPQL